MQDTNRIYNAAPLSIMKTADVKNEIKVEL